jgi:hypothetical protein
MLALGATASNQAQWMNHTSSTLAGLDCVGCHASDATKPVSAWSKQTKFHGTVTSVTTCKECHGLSNGLGSTVGTNNNLPSGLTSSSVVTSASTSAGIPAGTHDQISHADFNVTSNDCNLCHTQKGPSTTAGVMGKEWAQASLHANFSSTSPMVINGSTGRCSDCHVNVKPTAAGFSPDHSGYTATSPDDCSKCHAYPGSNPSSPNWLGASGEPHASSGSTAGSSLSCATCHAMGGSASMQLTVATASHFGGISNGNTCTSCHIDFSGFKGTTAQLNYGHANSAANAKGCEGCHQYAGQLYTTLTTTPPLQYPTTSGGHQFSQTYSVTARNHTSTHTDTHFTQCGGCHQYNGASASSIVWTYQHDPGNPGINNSCSSGGCAWCHGNGGC